MQETKICDAGYLHRLDDELYRVGFGRGNMQSLEFYEQGYTDSPDGWIEASFLLSNCVATLDTLAAKDTDIRFPLTQQTVAYAQRSRRPDFTAGDDIGDFACLEMEPRLLRSLSWHEQTPFTNEIADKHKPATILFGVDGEPCGYQKASGNAHAYIWRDSDISTETGVFSVAKDSFIQLSYYTGEDPREHYPGTGLIALEQAQPPLTIDFLRFSTACLTTSLRVNGANTAAYREPKLSANVPEMSIFSSISIGDRVQHLLKQERALRVTRSLARRQAPGLIHHKPAVDRSLAG